MEKPTRASSNAPNIVVILLDDVGFGASSTFGGAVQTPQLDKLAARGLRYNRFHVMALCSPTRAGLLSGRYAHKADFGTVVDVEIDAPGYTGMWRKDTVSVAEMLRRNGYSTAAFGKWHNTPYREVSPVGPFDRWPTGLGFEYFFGFMGAEDSQWEPSLYRDTTPVETIHRSVENRHLTTILADDAIRWIYTHKSLAPEQPYFLYFATGATHKPHHAPKEWIERYRGRFNLGWDKLREEIFARQKKLGVIPLNSMLPPRPQSIPSWDSLSADERRLFARQMEVYAGFLAHTDHEVGRLIQAIQQSNGAENTLILFIVGDNGADAGGPISTGSEEYADPTISPDVHERLRYIDQLGSKRFKNSYASGWAWAESTPFRGTKGDASHFGGTRVPLIVSWPVQIKSTGSVRAQFLHVTDIAATLYEVAGIQFPSEVDGVAQQPLDGISFVYSFDDAVALSRRRTQIFEPAANRAIYQDGWVAAASGADLVGSNENQWELYRIDTDFSQAHDLAARYPQKLQDLRALYEKEARRNNIHPFDLKTSNRRLSHTVAIEKRITYHSGLPRTPSNYVVPTFSRSHRITAEVVIPERGAEGVLISAGSRSSGFALYIAGNHLVYENHPLARDRTTITSHSPLPRGKATLAYEFTHEPTASVKLGMLNDSVAPGIGRLYVNGQCVGEGRQGPVITWVYGYGAHSGTLGIGRAFESPVSTAFQPPFQFTGTLTSVIVEPLN